MLTKRIKQLVGERIRHVISLEQWLQTGETITNVNVFQPDEVAVESVAPLAPDNVAFEFYLSMEEPVAGVFRVLFRVDTTDGQQKELIVELVVPGSVAPSSTSSTPVLVWPAVIDGGVI